MNKETKMPLTQTEKQRRYREKRDKDPERRKAYLEREKQKYQDDKKTGKKCGISQMSDRRQRRQRRLWRTAQIKHRKMKKQLKDSERNINVPQPLSVSMNFEKKVPAKKLASVKNKYRRDLEKLEKELRRQKQMTAKYKKRLERNIKRTSLPSTPRKRSKILLKSGKSAVQKTLLFHYSLIDDLRKKYSTTEDPKKRKLYAKLITGELIKKHRLKGYAKKILGLSGLKGENSTKTKTCKTIRLGPSVRAFFMRDDVSRVIPGKKQTVTFNKVKKQKRLLLDSLQNLHAKYLSENPDMKLSYTLFCRLRPFWVKYPTEADRQTCVCKVHDNMSLLFKSMCAMHVTDSCKPDDLVRKIVCDMNSFNCMYNKCDECKNNTFQTTVKIEDCEREKVVCWEQWKNVKEKRVLTKGGDSREIEVSVTVKKTESGAVSELIKEVDKQLVRYKKHLYNIQNQYSYYRNLISSLSGNECVIHIDFSENYVSKMHYEVQSMHFGASARQCTLHTGIYYVGNVQQSFCSVSSSTNHGPAAVWEHLAPVLDEIQSKYPAVDTVHFYSDGPTSQYRQKGNFYLFSTIPASRGIHKATWNFLEAGHGKGVPDGIGGVIKRTADRLVREKCDICNAESLYKILKQENLSIKLYFVEDSKIESAVAKLACKELTTVPYTMSLHQICTCKLYNVSYSDVSCCCMKPFTCICIQKRVFDFKTTTKNKKIKLEKDSTKVIKNVSEKKNNAEIKQGKESTKSDCKGKVRTETQGYKSYNQLSEITDENDGRNGFFSNMLSDFGACNDFADLQALCSSTYLDLPYDVTHQRSLSIVGNQFSVDLVSLDLCPDDVPGDNILFPVKVKADGDCLAHCGSIFAFGHEMNEVEIRARIVRELVNRKSKYLDYSYLRKGVDITDREAKKLPAEYAMFSENYAMQHMSDKNIEMVFENEVLNICKKGSYMGIWQTFALANVLQTNIYSVYPKLGNPNIRKQLHRQIMPSTCKEAQHTYYILWTTTRGDMKKTQWVPNHFVVIVPPDNANNSGREQFEINENEEVCKDLGERSVNSETEKTEGICENENVAESSVNSETEKTEGICENENVAESSVNSETEKTEGICENENVAESSVNSETEKTEGICENENVAESSVNSETEKTKGICENENVAESTVKNVAESAVNSDTGKTEDICENENVAESSVKSEIEKTENICENENVGESSMDSEEKKTDKPDNCENMCESSVRYVLVKYENKIYPGRVLESKTNEIRVSCLKPVKGKQNLYYWPRLPDICWYLEENIEKYISGIAKVGKTHFKIISDEK